MFGRAAFACLCLVIIIILFIYRWIGQIITDPDKRLEYKRILSLGYNKNTARRLIKIGYVRIKSIIEFPMGSSLEYLWYGPVEDCPPHYKLMVRKTKSGELESLN